MTPRTIALSALLLGLTLGGLRLMPSADAQSTPKSLTVFRTNYVIAWSWRAGEYGANDVMVSNQFMTIVAREDVTVTVTNENHNVVTIHIDAPIYPWDASQKFFTFQEERPTP